MFLDICPLSNQLKLLTNLSRSWDGDGCPRIDADQRQEERGSYLILPGPWESS